VKITADTITDEQIHDLRDDHAFENANPGLYSYRLCKTALGEYGHSAVDVARARARCAEILNTRAAEAVSE
jgi:hypothetical protein